MTSPEAIRRIPEVSLNLLSKKLGIVIELLATWVYIRKRGATNKQLRYDPIVSPIAMHKADSTTSYISPSKPMINKKDIKSATTLKAIHTSPNLIASKKYYAQSIIS